VDRLAGPFSLRDLLLSGLQADQRFQPQRQICAAATAFGLLSLLGSANRTGKFV